MSQASVTIEPPPAAWRKALEPSTLSTTKRTFRSELGLPTDRPIVMTGHQCTLWHAGIFAKFAAAHAARSLGAQAAWLWVDQDATDAHRVRVPTLEDGRLGEMVWLLTRERDAGVADALLPPIEQPEAPPEAIHPKVRDQAAALADALRAAAAEPNRAAQFAAALRATVLSRYSASSITATGLARTTLFNELLDSMRREPRACVEAYNRAAREFPEAGIRELSLEEPVELPLWSLGPGPRRAVRAGRTDNADQGLAPRAIFMTALVRSAGCELFIHGTGGGAYDRVAERWWELWQGEALAPMAIVTATRTLDLLDAPIPTGLEVERARARAHRAAHDPALVGDADAAREKRDLLAAIANAPRHSPERRSRFEAMHRLLAQVASTHAGAIDRLRADADRAADQLASAELAADRTWPAGLFEPGSLDAVAESIDRAFAAA